MSHFRMNPIGPDDKRGWKITVDGKEIKAGQIEMESKFGKLTYGMRPEGYDSWVFAQANGGGAVTLPYAWINGQLYFGLVKETRQNLFSEPVLCIIGGFIEPNQTPEQAQAAEADEEGSLDTTKARELKGLPTVPNRLFNVCDLSQREGDHTFAIELLPSMLEPDQNDESVFVYRLKGSELPGLKNRSNVVFLPWRMAVRATPDAIAHSAMVKLLAELTLEVDVFSRKKIA